MWSRASGNGPHAKITDFLHDLDILLNLNHASKQNARSWRAGRPQAIRHP
jgi:hypothetical protein